MPTLHELVMRSLGREKELTMGTATFDLGQFTSVPLSTVATDANGNQLTLPTVFSVDDTSLVAITDNGDGTAIASRVDATSAGSVTISATVTNPDGSTVTGTLTFSLSAQSTPAANAVDVQIIPGQPS